MSRGHSVHNDVIIVGAGAAGLAAARILTDAGLTTTVIEARSRVGGRTWTVQGKSGNPIELGAEFVHGQPKEILQRAARAGVRITGSEGQSWCSTGSTLEPCGFWEQIQAAGEVMAEYDGPDITFAQYLAQFGRDIPEDVRHWWTEYVEGFNGATADRIGVQSLIRSEEAANEIGGNDIISRIGGGYGAFIDVLRDGMAVELNRAAKRVIWSTSGVTIETDGGKLSCRCALITLPAPVLPSLAFTPELRQKQEAARRLGAGTAVKVVYELRSRFWESLYPDMRAMSMLHSRDPEFPTWWASTEDGSPVLTGWAGGPRAQLLSALSDNEMVVRGLEALGRVLHLDRERIAGEITASHWHNWTVDPCSRGAYAYVPVGGAELPARLAEPVEGALFFAGEATNAPYIGTVHGAIASGERAAEEIKATLR